MNSITKRNRKRKPTVLRYCPHCCKEHFVRNEPPYECHLYRLPTDPVPVTYMARRTGVKEIDDATAAMLKQQHKAAIALPKEVIESGRHPADDLNPPRF